jgi:hypothetical protein
MNVAAMREATASVRQRYLNSLPADLVRAYLPDHQRELAVT